MTIYWLFMVVPSGLAARTIQSVAPGGGTGCGWPGNAARVQWTLRETPCFRRVHCFFCSKKHQLLGVFFAGNPLFRPVNLHVSELAIRQS